MIKASVSGCALCRKDQASFPALILPVYTHACKKAHIHTCCNFFAGGGGGTQRKRKKLWS